MAQESVIQTHCLAHHLILNRRHFIGSVHSHVTQPANAKVLLCEQSLVAEEEPRRPKLSRRHPLAITSTGESVVKVGYRKESQ